MLQYKKVELEKHKSDVLIIHCADPRFQEAYRELIDNLKKYYDLLVMPGASKAVVSNPTTLDYITLLHGLHNFKAIHIMDHIECGAFGKIDNEVSAHSEMLKQAEAKILGALPALRVIPHLLDERKELELKISH
jgi:hypothetical protein